MGERAESCRSPRLRSQSSTLANAAIQPLSELNPIVVLDSKVSDAQETDFAELRLVTDTRHTGIYAQARPRLTIPEPATTGKRNKTKSPGATSTAQFGKDISSMAILRVGEKNGHDLTGTSNPAVLVIACYEDTRT